MAAGALDESSYRFRVVNGGPVTVKARLVYRRAFKSLAEIKAWPLAHIETEKVVVTVP